MTKRDVRALLEFKRNFFRNVELVRFTAEVRTANGRKKLIDDTLVVNISVDPEWQIEATLLARFEGATVSKIELL